MKKDDTKIDLFFWEEEFHGQDRKESKKEKKLARSLDRSKYKKTDQKQLAKKAKVPLLEKNLIRGRVLSLTGENVTIDADNEIYSCTVRGFLKKEKSRSKNIIAVGDFVLFSPEKKSIFSVEDRFSTLSREDLVTHKQQTIAVNIDQVFITVSVVSPPLKPTLVDRYMIAAKKGNMQPIVIVNKIDLLQNNNSEDIQQEKEKYENFLASYESAGIVILSMSAEKGIGIDALKNLMKNKASVFSGQSGVGKSSLINITCTKNLKTGKVVAKTLKGAHITTTAQLIPLEKGGFCIDTPGIKSFGIWKLTKQEVLDHFSEFHPFANECKYLNCTHLTEPECKVQEGLKENCISSLRFESYRSLMKSVAQEQHQRQERR